MDGDLDARGATVEGAAAGIRVGDAAEGDGGLADDEVSARDLDTEGFGFDVFYQDGFGSHASDLLELDFEGEWRRAGECDWNLLVAFSIRVAEAVGLAWLVESCGWALVDCLLDVQGREAAWSVLVVLVT